MYYFIAAIIIIINAVLSLSALFKSERVNRVIKITAATLSAIGVALILYAVTSLKIKLSVNSDSTSLLSSDTVSWIGDTYFLYFKWALIIVLIIGICVFLSSLIQPKRKKLRMAICFFSPVMILLSSLMYSLTAESSSINLSGYILLTGIGLSLLFPLFRFADVCKEKKPNKTIKETPNKNEKN